MGWTPYILTRSTVPLQSCTFISVAGPGCFIPDPGSRIPDPKTATKEKAKKICCPTLFVATKITKLKIILFLSMWRKSLALFTKNYKTFYPKNVIKLAKIWVWDPGSEIRKNLFCIPDPGAKKAPDPGSWSATLLPILRRSTCALCTGKMHYASRPSFLSQLPSIPLLFSCR